MPVAPGPSKRFVLLLVACSALVAIIFVSAFRSQAAGTRHPNNINTALPANHVQVQQATLTGGTIMPKLGNETLKAELGRASWKLFHTILARYPEAPDEDERTALQSYLHLFVRLYPCGECAEHFRVIVDKFPPQVSSRSAAAVWGCHVHNEVNKSLNKEVFDCATIGEFYDCGCAEDEKEGVAEVAKVTRAVAKRVRSLASAEKTGIDMGKRKLPSGANERALGSDSLPRDRPLELEKSV
ncbi:hypothetical protein LTR08_009257 [Meristemomyces frigidus]|nr:hypothetical protein LTR08_009257 [Meristemomyces frigidus]